MANLWNVLSNAPGLGALSGDPTMMGVGAMQKYYGEKHPNKNQGTWEDNNKKWNDLLSKADPTTREVLLGWSRQNPNMSLVDKVAFAEQTIGGGGGATAEVSGRRDWDALMSSLTPEGQTFALGKSAENSGRSIGELVRLVRADVQSRPEFLKSTATAAGVASSQEAAQRAQQEQLLQQNTARKMALMNQALQGQRAQGQQAIRQQLAQRNMLNSGSLQGTMAKNDRYFGELAARGGMLAATEETGGLMDWLNQQKQNQFQERLQRQSASGVYPGAQSALQQQRSWQLQDIYNKNTQDRQRREQNLWGSILGTAGNAVGSYYGGMSGGMLGQAAGQYAGYNWG